jgi:hypothetical protein
MHDQFSSDSRPIPYQLILLVNCNNESSNLLLLLIKFSQTYAGCQSSQWVAGINWLVDDCQGCIRGGDGGGDGGGGAHWDPPPPPKKKPYMQPWVLLIATTLSYQTLKFQIKCGQLSSRAQIKN